MVRERFLTYKACGINSLSLRIDSDEGQAQRISQLEQIMDIVKDVS